MTDRPIIFSAPMVRALLDGRKTQTRRIIKPRGKRASLFDGGWSDSFVLDPGNAWWRDRDVRYAVGDRLYVREAHVIEEQAFGIPDYPPPHDDGRPIRHNSGWYQPHYRATDPTPVLDYDGEEGCKWRPSIHMPRWASRLTLIVEGVKVERVQDISEADAIAEGIERIHYPEIGEWGWPQRKFAALWSTLHTKPGERWEDNPFVVALTFRVERRNIDQEIAA